MPERQTTEKAKSKLRHGRSPSTAAGEFVREDKAVWTKGPAVRRAAARKAARTRARHA